MHKQIIIFSCLLNIISLNAQMVFLEEPEAFNPKLEVASCYVTRKEKILFLKRCASSTWSYLWGLPGGKIEEGQSPYEAMIREVFEETGLDLSKKAPSFIKKVYVRDPKKDFIYYIFLCEFPDECAAIILTPDEHTEYKWLTPIQALQELELVPGEDECLRLIFGIIHN